MKKLMKSLLLGLFLSCLIWIPLKAQNNQIQFKDKAIQSSKDKFLGLNIFDPSKLTISHSVSMSYFTMGNKSLSRSLYMNTLRYQIAPPLMLQVQWGIQSFPHNSFAQNHPALQNGLFLSGAELKYKPNDKFEMIFQYRRIPGMYNPYQYYNPFYNQHRSTWEQER